MTVEDVLREAAASRLKWGAYRSQHEAYGVLAEEMHELLHAIQDNDEAAIRHEALQVSAVALRLASEGWKR